MLSEGSPVRRWSRLKAAVLLPLLVVLTGALAACGGDDSSSNSSAASGSGELQKVRLGVAPFQDLLSVYIGIEKGWYEEEGLDLEATNVELQEAGEALVGGSVDMASMCDVDALVKAPQAPDLRFSNPAYIFLGSALIVRPDSGMKTYEEFIDEGMDHDAAVAAVGAQLKGKTAIAVGNSDQELAIIVTAQKGGMDNPKKEMKFVDLEANEGLAAFLAGEGDVYNGGLPQRNRALKEGMKTLIGAADLRPEGVIHCGFGTTQKFLDENMDVAVKFQRVWYRIQQAIADDPDGTFPIIRDELNERTGAEITVDELKDIWNNLELFPTSDKEMSEQILTEGGEYHWEDRFAYAKEYYTKAGSITGDYNLDDVYAYPELSEAYAKAYPDDAAGQ